MNTTPYIGRSLRGRARQGLTLLELVMVVSILAILTALVVPGMSDQQEETRKIVARATMQELRDVIANRYMNDMQSLPQPDMINDNSSRMSTTLQAISSITTTALPQMHFLFVNPQYSTVAATTPYVAVNNYDAQTRIGWNGPYVMAKSTLYPNPTLTRFATATTSTTTLQTWADYGFTTQFGQPGDYCVMDPWGSPYVILARQTAHGGSTVFTSYIVSAGFNRQLETTTNGTASTGDDLLLPIKAMK
jgi:prepilin-type N-terminal cleavage/methylation domain-containing protein